MISTPDRQRVILLIHEAQEAGARLKPACELLCISLRTFQRWNKEGVDTKDKRPFAIRKPPKNKLTKEEQENIVTTSVQPDYIDLNPPQIVPTLADKGIFIGSESTFYRVWKEYKLNAKRTATRTHSTSSITTYIATQPNQVWTWDITWIPGEAIGFYYRLYLIVDIFSRFIIQWEMHKKELQSHAKELIKKAVFKYHQIDTPLVLHSDNGSPMKAQSFQNLLTKLGITKSYSRPRVSNDNPYSESLFKTLKYTKDFPCKGFASIEKAREWVFKFVNLYNTEFLHSGIKFVTPYQRHYGEDIAILAKRKEVYRQAKLKHPERWSKEIRNWDWIDQVALNPVNDLEKNLGKEK